MHTNVEHYRKISESKTMYSDSIPESITGAASSVFGDSTLHMSTALLDILEAQPDIAAAALDVFSKMKQGRSKSRPVTIWQTNVDGQKTVVMFGEYKYVDDSIHFFVI